MSDYVTYRDTRLMNEVLNQGRRQICWAIALTRQGTAILRDLGHIKDDERLSIQYLINSAGSTASDATRRAWKGGVCSMSQASAFFGEGGSVLNGACRLTYNLKSRNPSFEGQRRFIFRTTIHRRSTFPSLDEFEKRLETCLRSNPIAVAVYNFRSLSRNIGKNEVYAPNDAEIKSREERGDRNGQHVMLLCGSSREEWSFQDSGGTRRGDAGYLTFRRGIETITEFAEMIFVRVEVEGDNTRQGKRKRQRQDSKNKKKGQGSKNTSKGQGSKNTRRGGHGGTVVGQGSRQYGACSGSTLVRESTWRDEARR